MPCSEIIRIKSAPGKSGLEGEFRDIFSNI